MKRRQDGKAQEEEKAIGWKEKDRDSPAQAAVQED
jgi:hypothetical protein